MSDLNIMNFGDFGALISYDASLMSFRGEFIGLNGGADFYGKSVTELKVEGENSLNAFIDECKKRQIDPVKQDHIDVNCPSSKHLRPEVIISKGGLAFVSG